jgi:light-regulated signal transduction histidine kinase (bacteriophytochrome)
VGPFELGILRVAAASGFQAVSSEIELGKLIETLLQSSRVALRVERASALPIVLADKVQLQQVILNLVLNGIEAMQPVADRPRELVIRLEHEDAQHVRVTVSDCGVGFSADRDGTVDLSFDHRTARRAHQGVAQYTSGCEQPVLTTLGSRSGGSLKYTGRVGPTIATN